MIYLVVDVGSGVECFAGVPPGKTVNTLCYLCGKSLKPRQAISDYPLRCAHNTCIERAFPSHTLPSHRTLLRLAGKGLYPVVICSGNLYLLMLMFFF